MLSVAIQSTFIEYFYKIFLGSGIGLIVALAIGAAFIAVWFTQASDLWAKSEDLWEGVCNTAKVVTMD